MEHEERCNYSYEKDNNFFCNIADGYKCPFNGRYHKMEHDIFGGKYINGQDKTGCEVCVASNCGFDKGKSEGYKKSETIFAVCAGDIEKFSEPDKIFSSKEKAMQYLEDLSKFYNWKKPVVRTTDERFSNRTVVEIDTKTFVIIEHELL